MNHRWQSYPAPAGDYCKRCGLNRSTVKATGRKCVPFCNDAPSDVWHKVPCPMRDGRCLVHGMANTLAMVTALSEQEDN